SEIQGYVADSGEGRWTVQEAIDLAVPAPVISASLFARFDSRQEESPAMKAVAPLREQFGGHAVKRSADGWGSRRRGVARRVRLRPRAHRLPLLPARCALARAGHTGVPRPEAAGQDQA